MPSSQAASGDSDNQELYCNSSGAKATGLRTADGFVVKKGSKIAEKVTKSCPEYAIKKREQYKDIIDDNFVLLEDILFNTPSGAVGFVCGASKSGNAEWKTADGITLKELEAKTEE